MQLPPDSPGGRLIGQLAGLTLYDATALSDLTDASPRYVLNLGAVWTVGKLAVNLEEQIYKTSEWENDDGDNPTNMPEYWGFSSTRSSRRSGSTGAITT